MSGGPNATLALSVVHDYLLLQQRFRDGSKPLLTAVRAFTSCEVCKKDRVQRLKM